jgi:hypothetical protein
MGCSGLDIFLAMALAGRRPCTWMISTAVDNNVSGTSVNAEGHVSDVSGAHSGAMPFKAGGVVAVSEVDLLCPVNAWVVSGTLSKPDLVSGAALSALSDTGPAGVASV